MWGVISHEIFIYYFKLIIKEQKITIMFAIPNRNKYKYTYKLFS
jgi:hypothetical protein